METPEKNQNEQIENLLENAQQALSQDHLLYPKETSAYAYLSLALELNPNDENAKRGFEPAGKIDLSITQKRSSRAQDQGSNQAETTYAN